MAREAPGPDPGNVVYIIRAVAVGTRVLLAGAGRRVSRYAKSVVLSVQEWGLLSARAFSALLTRPRPVAETLAQMDSLGVGSVSIVILTGVFTGMVLALQSSATLDAFGARPYVGRLVCISMVRELGPVLTALMVTGRVGSAMAAELGSMVVTQQIDALRVLGSDPVRKLVAPRVAAAMIMVPVLTVLSDTVGIFGGALISIFSLGLTWEFYWRSVAAALSMNDLAMGLSKPIAFGFLTATVGCFMGLSTSGGSLGVGSATTRSVVAASVLILASDFFLTKLLLILFPVV
jgi:phospholipid/cholesterol/gamma-HCH transport system permease protein